MYQMNFKKGFFLLLLLHVSFTTIYCQNTFKGNLINKKGYQIAGAAVYILNTNLITITNNNGQFSFVKLDTGSYVIKIISSGFATLQASIKVTPHQRNDINTYTLSESISQLDDVIVTAQKKEELLQQIPLSVSAFSSNQIEKLKLWNNKDISGVIPNLYSTDPGDNRDVTSIRGITSTSYDPAVATYIDGVNQFSLDTYIPVLFDIENIEVLRGPQGTLYGRNAMGGVLNIITKQPSNILNGYGEVAVGNYGQQRYTAGIKSPIIKNKLFVGTAFLLNQRDGFYTNNFNNETYDKQNSFSGNYFIKYIPNEHWQLNFNAKHYKGTNNGAFPLVFGIDEAINHPYKLNQNSLTKMMDNTFNTSMSINYIGSQFNFSSISAYQNNYRYYTQPIDGDFSPLDAVSVINNFGNKWNNIKVISQEFKISAPTAKSNNLKWTIGSYFFYQDAPVKQGTRFGIDANMMMVGDSLFTIINSSKSTKKGIALYGQATYAIHEKINLTVGLRNDYEQQTQSVIGYYQHDPNPDAFIIFPDTLAKINFSALSPKVSLDYNINNTLLYASYNKGFRTGGLSTLSSDPSQPPLNGYKPEFSNNFEIGLKNDFFSKKLRINIVAFYTHITDAQVPTLQLPDAIIITKNTGKLNTKGMEAEILTTPIKGLLLQYNIGYTNAIFESLSLAQQGSIVNLNGKHQIFTPDMTSFFAIQYNHTFEQHKINAYVRAESKKIGNTYFDLNNNIKQTPYSIQNISMGVNMKNTSIVGWSRNIFNTKFVSYAYDFVAVHLGDPCTFGITISNKF